MRGLIILLGCCVGACAFDLMTLKPKEKGLKVAKVEKLDPNKMVGDLTNAERATQLPKFFWMNEISHRDAEGFSWGSYRWSQDNAGLRNHPARVNKPQDAKFVIACCLEEKTKEKFLQLPVRPVDRPYLVKTLKGGADITSVFEKRPDFYALNYDLRDNMDKQSEPLRGVTIAPHNFFSGKKIGVNATRKFFVTFQGRKTSKLRHELHDAFNNHRRFKLFRNISVETVMDRMWNVNQQTGDANFNAKMNSSYVLLPKGDDRWSLRFSETLGSGAIPVILADGLTLPYEHIIDWSKAAIRLPNSYGQNADEIMRRLPTDKKKMMQLREEVYSINRRYFANPDVRADALLLEADAIVKNGGKYDPIWKPESAEPWLEQERVGATTETKLIAAPLARAMEPKALPKYLTTDSRSQELTALSKPRTLIKRN